MSTKKTDLDDALEFIFNGADSELESLSEDFGDENFHFPAIVTDNLENSLCGEVNTARKRNGIMMKAQVMRNHHL